MRTRQRLLVLATSLLTVQAWHGNALEDLKIGMIGLDTSHVIAFTQLLNDPNNAEYVPGGKVVAGFKGGSPDIPASADRVDGFTKQLQEDWGVKIVPTIE